MIILFVSNDNDLSKYVTLALTKYVQYPIGNDKMVIKASGHACHNAIAVHEKLKKYFLFTDTLTDIGTLQSEPSNSKRLYDVPFIEIMSNCKIIEKGISR